MCDLSVRRQRDRAGRVGQFLSGPQGPHGAVPGARVRHRGPELSAASVRGGIPAGPESRRLAGHGQCFTLRPNDERLISNFISVCARDATIQLAQGSIENEELHHILFTPRCISGRHCHSSRIRALHGPKILALAWPWSETLRS